MSFDPISAFAPSAGRVLHVCRLYAPKYRGTRGLRVATCVDCERLVVVTPKVFRQRAAALAELGRELEIACDDCALRYSESAAAVAYVHPTAAERAEARRIDLDEGRL